jgi:hypothetical protein
LTGWNTSSPLWYLTFQTPLNLISHHLSRSPAKTQKCKSHFWYHLPVSFTLSSSPLILSLECTSHQILSYLLHLISYGNSRDPE